MTAERTAELLRGVNPRSKVLELGPNATPLASRAEGWDVTVVDHGTRAELIDKYRADPNVNVNKIEEVDFVWRNGPLHEALPLEMHGSFDVLIASHVIEHLPDPVGFLKSATRLLHPQNGVLVLAVPDKRWCFDCLKQVSSTGQFLAAHRMRAQRHSLATRFDHLAYIAFDQGRGGWGRAPFADLQLVDNLEQAFAQFQSWSDDPNAPYVDCHAWIFTPASFELLILEASAVGLTDWQVSWLKPCPTVEFLAHLVPGKQHFISIEAREQHRLRLLKQILLDIREQTDFLVESMPVHPAQAAWNGMLPLRRKIARWRGRIQ